MSHALHGIAEVERDTGIGKDTLRVWERRYGFPVPERDTLGERRYDDAQVQRLRVLRRLLDQGHRPGQVVALPLSELQALSERPAATGRRPAAARALPTPVPLDPSWLADLQAHRLDALRQALHRHMLRHGLVATLESVVAPLAAEVGRAWADGRLSIFEEHLFSEAVEAVLREAIAGLAPSAGSVQHGPRVLLTTLPGEQHTLGLLMAEAVLALQGCERLPLGASTPIAQIIEAAGRLRADVVAIGTSAHAAPKPLREDLRRLREGLPAAQALWVGGPARAALGRAGLPGVQVMARVGELVGAVQAWRASAGG